MRKIFQRLILIMIIGIICLPQHTFAQEKQPPKADLFPLQPANSSEKSTRSDLNDEDTRWIEAEAFGEIIYIVYPNPAHIDRFDMRTHQWLASITLPTTPNGFAVDENWLYLSYGNQLVRLDHSGSGETVLDTYPEAIGKIISAGSYLLLLRGPEAYTERIVRKDNGMITATNVYDATTDAVYDPDHNQIIGCTYNHRFSFIISPTGTIEAYTTSTFEPSTASVVYLSPDKKRVLDDGGGMYYRFDMTYSTSINIDPLFQDGFTYRIEAAAFYGSQLIFAKSGYLHAYSPGLEYLDSYLGFYPAQGVFVFGTEIFSLSNLSGYPVISIVDPDDLDLRPPDASLPVEQIRFTPDQVFAGVDGTLYLLSKIQLSIFRWSQHEKRYLTPIALDKPPVDAAYHPETNRLFLAYSNGQITQIPLDTGTIEVPFAQITKPLKLGMAGSFLIAASQEYHPRFFALDLNGNLIDQPEINTWIDSPEIIWNAVTGKIYWYDLSGSTARIHSMAINPDGSFGDHQIANDFFVFARGPLRISPDGTIGLTGTGRIFDPETLEFTGSFPGGMQDALWHSNQLYTYNKVDSLHSQLEQRSASYTIQAAVPVNGKPLRMLEDGPGLTLLSSVWDKPGFTYIDAALQVQSTSAANSLVLPLIRSLDPCSPYFDDFSDPASGWYTGEDSFARYDYSDGKYHIRPLQNDYLYFAMQPGCRYHKYEIDFQARNAGRKHAGYGAAVQILGGLDAYVLFLIFPESQEWGTWIYEAGTLTPWRSGPARDIIASDQLTNYFHIQTEGSSVAFYVNGARITDAYIEDPYIRSIALVAYPYYSDGPFDITFDNFSVNSP